MLIFFFGGGGRVGSLIMMNGSGGEGRRGIGLVVECSRFFLLKQDNIEHTPDYGTHAHETEVEKQRLSCTQRTCLEGCCGCTQALQEYS